MKKLHLLVLIFSILGSSLFAQEAGLIPFRNAQNLWGYVDAAKKIIIPCEYEKAGFFTNGVAEVYKDRETVFINNTGEVIVSGSNMNAPKYIGDGIIIVHNPFKSTAQYYDKTGFIFESEYAASSFSEGMGVVEQSNEWCYIDRTGKVALSFKNQPVVKLDDFCNGYGIVHFNRFDNLPKGFSRTEDSDQPSFWGAIDKKGKYVSKKLYRFVYPYKNGFFRVDWVYKTSFMNTTGKVIANFQYENAEDFSCERAVVSEDELYGYLDKNGKNVIKFQYEKALSFTEDLGAVKLGGKWGFIDKSGKTVIPNSYDEVHPFSEGFAAVKTGNTWNLINHANKTISQEPFEEVSDFSHNVAAVKKGGVWGLINSKGEMIVEPKYESMDLRPNGFMEVSLKDNKGYIDSKGIQFWE